MKDLYRALGLSRKATNGEIAEALEQRPEFSDYASVLLNEQKRAVYDRAHAALTSIGALRHRLNLDKDPSWFDEKHPDFSPAARKASSEAAESAAAPAPGPVKPSAAAPPAAQQPSPPPKARRAGRGSLAVLVLALAALAAILYLALF